MSKSGLFAHFRSKEDVQVQLLEHMARLANARVVEPAMKAAEGLPRLRVLVRHWFGWAQRAGLPGGCPVAAGLFEFDDVENPVRDKIFELESHWRDLVTGLVAHAVSLGHLRRDLDKTQFVWELCGIYLSHHAAHRFLRAADAGRRANIAFESLVRRSLPAATTGKAPKQGNRRTERRKPV
jgi:AcrR family transcriptional regulator